MAPRVQSVRAPAHAEGQEKIFGLSFPSFLLEGEDHRKDHPKSRLRLVKAYTCVHKQALPFFLTCQVATQQPHLLLNSSLTCPTRTFRPSTIQNAKVSRPEAVIGGLLPCLLCFTGLVTLTRLPHRLVETDVEV